MKYSVLRGHGLIKNIIFDSASPANRDNCFAPYVLLKDYLNQRGIKIDTADLQNGEHLDFEIHQDVQSESNALNNYLLMLEANLIRPENGLAPNWKKYRKIFTWNDSLVDGNRFIKINHPNPIHINSIDGFKNRNHFCCLIAANKNIKSRDERNLYPERVRVIRWFEKNAPLDFDLYGQGWDFPALGIGLMGKLENRFFRIISRFISLVHFPSYRGPVAHKREVLIKTRFSVCYENIRDIPGYITEKIFDCFFSGCVPVYWGASNISTYIPEDCFIDRRNFRGIKEVYEYLKLMTEDEFIGYQERIATFLMSDAALPFASQFFADTIAKEIVKDIGN